MKKTFKKKNLWKEKENKKNIKKTKIISAYRNYRDVYDDLLEYKKEIISGSSSD